MKDGSYEESLRLLKGLMSDYPDNHALYSWMTAWYLEQGKKTDGITFFEKLYAEKLSASPKLAQCALYEKAILQQADGKNAEARATLARLRAVRAPDPALVRTMAALEPALK
jgi:predicted Zn-dependent protease